MGAKDLSRVYKKHGESLKALDNEMNAGQYHQALETLKRILGDQTLPSDLRVLMRAREAEALLELGRTTEALVSVSQIESTIRNHRLYRLKHMVEGVIARVNEARGA